LLLLFATQVEVTEEYENQNEAPIAVWGPQHEHFRSFCGQSLLRKLKVAEAFLGMLLRAGISSHSGVERGSIKLTFAAVVLLAASCGVHTPRVSGTDSSSSSGSVLLPRPSTTAATPADGIVTPSDSLERLARTRFGDRYAGVDATNDLVVVFVAGSYSSDPPELDGHTIKHVTYSYTDLQKAMDNVTTVAPTHESEGHPLFELGIDVVTNSVLLVVPNATKDGPAFLAALGSGPYRFAAGSQPQTTKRCARQRSRVGVLSRNPG
jgi:hypothetical protein